MLPVEQQVSLTLFLIKDRNRHTSDFHVAPNLITESSQSTYSVFAHASAPNPQSTQDGGKAQSYGLYFLRAIFVAPGVQ
jgi:hypothetical protein